MSSGKAHDLSIAIMTPVVIVASSIYLPAIANSPIAPLVTLCGYLAGGIWLSPDIDLKQSRPSQRLGILSPLWQPYRKASGHRGFSHIPLIGTASRLIYLTLPVIIWMLLNNFNPTQLIWLHRDTLGSFYLGLELSALLHLCLDYILIFRD